MSALSLVRLELGRTHIFPQGNPRYGYEFVVPLTAHGHVDAQAWRHAKERCWVRHFSGEGRDTYGLLRHVGHDWYFDCGYEREAGNAFFKHDQHAFVPGSSVAIRERDGVTRPFLVTWVSPVTVGQPVCAA